MNVSDGDRRDTYVKKLYEYSNKHETAKDGTVKVNGKDFLSPAPAAGMSTAERSYFVAGNLAAVYHTQAQTVPDAWVQDGTVLLGNQPIITPQNGDPSAQELANRLNTIK